MFYFGTMSKAYALASRVHIALMLPSPCTDGRRRYVSRDPGRADVREQNTVVVWCSFGERVTWGRDNVDAKQSALDADSRVAAAPIS
jgi:hypothetical protein